MNIDKKERKILLGKSKPVTITKSNKYLKKYSWLKWFGFRDKVHTIEISPLPYGVVLQITECLSDVEIPEKIETVKQAAEFINDNQHIVANVIGFALKCDSRDKVPKSTMNFIKLNMSAIEATEIFYFVIEQTHMVDFMTAISLTTQRMIAKPESQAKQN